MGDEDKVIRKRKTWAGWKLKNVEERSSSSDEDWRSASSNVPLNVFSLAFFFCLPPPPLGGFLSLFVGGVPFSPAFVRVVNL